MSFESLKTIVDHFQHVPGTVVSITPYGSGHINDTFRVRIQTTEIKKDINNQETSYILQRINQNVFPRPKEVMENIVRVTQHLSNKISSRGGDPSRETLTLAPTTNGNPENYFIQDDEGNYWRMYTFILGATALEIGSNKDNNTQLNDRNKGSYFFEVAATFSRFQKDMIDFSPPRLHETIKGFGDTELRFRHFQETLKLDSKDRADGCRDEIEFCLAREKDALLLPSLLKEGEISERIVHYDTKINNVLIDNETGKGLCVVDLDTVMPGLALYDFGDCVRAATALASEDEIDLSKVGFSMEIFKLLVQGFLSVENNNITLDGQIDKMVFAARIVTMTQGLRFLADHLAGDVYYKIERENHNLDRARTQFKMVIEMETNKDEMERIVQSSRGINLQTN